MRARPSDQRDFVSFGPGQAGFEVFLHVRVAAQLVTYLRQTEPNEAIGLLAGRPGRDERGPYTIITAALRAKDGEVEASPSRVRLTTEHQRLLRRRLASKEFIAEPVGWWHTHPHGPKGYSSVDLREQATWTEVHHVGLLVLGYSDPPVLRIYHGPEAIPLPQRHIVQQEARLEGDPVIVEDPHRIVLRRRSSPRAGAEFAVMYLLSWIALLVAMAVGFAVLDLRLQRPDRSELGLTTLPSGHLVTVKCDPREGAAPLIVTCEAWASRSFVETLWEFEEGRVLSGPVATYSYLAPGEYTVSWIGIEPDGDLARHELLQKVRVEVGG
jgi:proteasome lid subunit RPN8/RPN11